jgi:hypothetical protein
MVKEAYTRSPKRVAQVRFFVSILPTDAFPEQQSSYMMLQMAHLGQSMLSFSFDVLDLISINYDEMRHFRSKVAHRLQV